jgi:hypothetical protein
MIFLSKPKLSDFIPYIIVAAGFSLRFSSSNGYMIISRKLRNPSIRSGQALKVAVTQIAQFRLKELGISRNRVIELEDS